MEGGEPAGASNASSHSLAAAHAALASGSPAAALALLAAVPPAQRHNLPARQLQALCHIQLAGRPCASASWLRVRRCLLPSMRAAQSWPAGVVGLVH